MVYPTLRREHCSYGNSVATCSEMVVRGCSKHLYALQKAALHIHYRHTSCFNMRTWKKLYYLQSV